MMKKKLTVALIASLPPGNYTDAACAGLTLRIGVKRRTWSVYHRLGGRLIQTTIGHFPTMGLADARKAAGELAARVEAGVAPLPAPAHPRAAMVTLGQVVDRYERHRRQVGGRGLKTLDKAMRTVRRGLGGYLDLDARQFSKADLRAARDSIAAKAPTMANRFQAYLSPVLRWGESEDILPHDFSRAVIRVGREVSRDRILSRDEIRAVWQASFDLGDTATGAAYGRLIRFLLCTGQRLGEGAHMRHRDILGGIWRQTENKASREHRLKLPPLALAQIGTGAASDMVFASKLTGRALNDHSAKKAKLDTVSGVSNWRTHDLRRTVASGMQEIGVSQDVIGAVLNHSVGTVTGTYLRAELDKAKAEALATWNAELEKIVAVGAKQGRA